MSLNKVSDGHPVYEKYKRHYYLAKAAYMKEGFDERSAGTNANQLWFMGVVYE
tara:strand:- start:1045 stop:1203 length:159 start_codon:yes stop_codon:yes gene_type:complete